MHLLRRVRALSLDFGLSPGFDLCLFVISCFYFSCFYFSMLLLLLFRSLVRLASLSSLFSIRARRRGAWVVLLGGLAALCLVSQLSVRSRGALLRRLGLRRCACASKCSLGGLALPNPRPSSLYFRDVQGASVLPVIGLAPRGEDGLVASVEETDSSARSTSSGRHSADLPIVGPPRGLLARASRRRILFRNPLLSIIYITTLHIKI